MKLRNCRDFHDRAPQRVETIKLHRLGQITVVLTEAYLCVSPYPHGRDRFPIAPPRWVLKYTPKLYSGGVIRRQGVVESLTNKVQLALRI